MATLSTPDLCVIGAGASGLAVAVSRADHPAIPVPTRNLLLLVGVVLVGSALMSLAAAAATPDLDSRGVTRD